MPTTFTVDLEPGQVRDVPLPGLVDGAYTVSVTATQPIVASGRISTVDDDGTTDFAWVSAAEPLDDGVLVAVPEGPAPTLHLSNPTGEAATVVIGPASGTGSQRTEVAAGASVSLAVPERAVLQLEGAAGLVAALSFAGPGALASYPLSVPAANSTAVRVYR